MRQCFVFSITILFFLFGHFVYAQVPGEVIEAIDYKIEKNLITYDGKFKVAFNLTDGLENKYYVRPVLSNGNVDIYDPNSGDWVRSGDVWSKMPLLNNEMYLRISSLGQQKHFLNFEVMDIRSGYIYELKQTNVYGKRVYYNYIDSVNMSIKNIQYLDETAVDKEPMWVQTGQNELAGTLRDPVSDNNTPFIWLYGIFVSLFLALLSTLVLLMKRSKRLAIS